MSSACAPGVFIGILSLETGREGFSIMQLRFQAAGKEGYEVIVKNHELLQYIYEFGILRLTEGGSFANNTGECEAILHIIEGSCTLTAENQQFPQIGARASPFAGPPTAVYLPPHTAYTVQSQHVEIAITLAKAEGNGTPILISPQDLSPSQVGHGNWQRTVTMIAPPDFPSQKLILGETLNPPGNWSGVPTHKHDTLQTEVESVHEELYYFRVDRPGGWGAERVYDKGELDELLLLQDRVVTIMPRGFHTLTAAPGYTLYYAFVLAGPTKTLHAFLDPDQAWIAE
jgi:5-deoxy-glucuronate isomerase